MPESLMEMLAPIHRLTVQQYHRMVEMGVLTEDDPVEFLEGWIVTKMPHNPAHDGTITRIQKRLEQELGEEWLIRIQSAITTRDSEPEPDLAVVSGPLEKYLERHPSPFDISLVIEVSDARLDTDRTLKGRLYARARLPVYWIANLPEKIIEVYSKPIGGKHPRYRERQDYGMEDRVPLSIVGVKKTAIAVEELLPPELPRH